MSRELQQYLCAFIVRNLAALHRTGQAHNDLKADNIVLAESDNGTIGTMIIDLGSAHSLSSPVSEWCTTINYVPPEVYAYHSKGAWLPKRPFDPRQVDMFNLGTTFFTILFQAFPFNVSAEQPDIRIDTLYQSLNDVANPQRLHDCTFFKLHQSNGKCDEAALYLIWHLMRPIPSQRPTLDQVGQFYWIKNAPLVPSEAIVSEMRSLVR